MRKLFLIVILLFAGAQAARAENVTVELVSDHVDITTGFNGTTLGLFGVRANRGDIAVIVRGPLRTMSVRRKESVMGAWINRSFETFKAVPSYYNYALSRPLEELTTAEKLAEHGIGPENLRFNKPDTTDKRRIEFREALLRNKRMQGLYPAEPGAIKFIGPNFFRADFYIPANVPVGEYEIQTLYFSNGILRDSKTNTVRVAQVGGSARINDFAHNNSLVYGLMCVLLAVFAGWFSNRVRRG
ncbi:MAG: transmembrane family protein [Alphaproteobacteria bacterium PRO2]|nr:transmembrane family protein [Alphaproteobacteria bacterium PRO2]